MVFSTDKDLLIEMEDSRLKFLVEKEGHSGEYTFVKTNGIDVHVMNKKSLSRIIDGVFNV
jgi:hypothetical protein